MQIMSFTKTEPMTPNKEAGKAEQHLDSWHIWLSTLTEVQRAEAIEQVNFFKGMGVAIPYGMIQNNVNKMFNEKN